MSARRQKAKKREPREMMELAVTVMRQSVPEHRPDGSPSPSVGAVLLRPDGSFEMAARGELREGNHAEYALLERKCIGERLDGSVLFTTLEPCLNRQAEKLKLPLPTFSMEGDYLVLTIYRSRKAAASALNNEALQTLNSAELSGWEFLSGRTGTTQSEYARQLSITPRTAQRHLTHFVQLRLLRRVGSGPATEYLKT